MEHKAEASRVLAKIGTSLLSIDQPGLALELLDEAMECALESDQSDEMERLADLLLMANAAMTKVDTLHHDGLRLLLDQLNTINEGSQKAFEERMGEIEDQVVQHMKPLAETWNDWQPSQRLIGDGGPLTVVRSEVDEHGHTLIVVHHATLGSLGVWLPEGRLPVSPGYLLSLGTTRVKVAPPTVDLQEQHSIRGIVAIEDSSALDFVVPTEEMTGED